MGFGGPGDLLAQSEEGEKGNQSRFTGDIDEQDIRVLELKKEWATGRTPPDNLHLRYRGVHDYVYLVFYDIRGHRVYYRFRDTRWDKKKMSIPEQLIPGQAYRVTGSPTGILDSTRLLQPDSADFEKALKDKDSIPVYQYSKSYPLRLDQLLL